jgi:hypothetical protein
MPYSGAFCRSLLAGDPIRWADLFLEHRLQAGSSSSALRCVNLAFRSIVRRNAAGLRSLSGGAVGFATETMRELRTLSQNPTNS